MFNPEIRQLQKDMAYIAIAENIGSLSHCVRKQVGCIIVSPQGHIISDGYNGTPQGMDNCCESEVDGETLWYVLHSESNAITKLAKSTLSSQDSTMYITLSPCKNCAKLILQSGIKRVVYKRKHSCQEGIEFLESQGIQCDYLDTKYQVNTIQKIGRGTRESPVTTEIVDLTEIEDNKYNRKFIINKSKTGPKVQEKTIIEQITLEDYNYINNNVFLNGLTYEEICKNDIINHIKNSIDTYFTDFNRNEKLQLFMLEIFTMFDFDSNNEVSKLLEKLNQLKNDKPEIIYDLLTTLRETFNKYYDNLKLPFAYSDVEFNYINGSVFYKNRFRPTDTWNKL